MKRLPGSKKSAVAPSPKKSQTTAKPPPAALPPGTLKIITHPKLVSALADVKIRIVSFSGSCGEHHSHALAVDSTGDVWGWGAGYKFKLGTGDDQPRYKPTPIDRKHFIPGAPPESSADAKSSGSCGASATTGNCTGAVMQVCCGGIHSTLQTASYDGYLWGCGSDGRLGFAEIEKRGKTARYLFKEKVPRQMRFGPFAESGATICLSANYYHSAAIAGPRPPPRPAPETTAPAKPAGD